MARNLLCFLEGTFRWAIMVTHLFLCIAVDCVDPEDGPTCDLIDKAVEAFANWMGGQDSTKDCIPLPINVKVLICIGHVSAVLLLMLVVLSCCLGIMKCSKEYRSKKMQMPSSQVDLADNDEDTGYY